jgi:hypothetical protein
LFSSSDISGCFSNWEYYWYLLKLLKGYPCVGKFDAYESLYNSIHNTYRYVDILNAGSRTEEVLLPAFVYMKTHLSSFTDLQALFVSVNAGGTWSNRP